MSHFPLPSPSFPHYPHFHPFALTVPISPPLFPIFSILLPFYPTVPISPDSLPLSQISLTVAHFPPFASTFLPAFSSFLPLSLNSTHYFELPSILLSDPPPPPPHDGPTPPFSRPRIFGQSAPEPRAPAGQSERRAGEPEHHLAPNGHRRVRGAWPRARCGNWGEIGENWGDWESWGILRGERGP